MKVKSKDSIKEKKEKIRNKRKEVRISLFTNVMVPIIMLMSMGMVISYLFVEAKVLKGFTNSNIEYVSSYDKISFELIEEQLNMTESTIGQMSSVLSYVPLVDTLSFINDMSSYLKNSLKMDSTPCYIYDSNGKPYLANPIYGRGSVLDTYIEQAFTGKTIKHILVDGESVIAAVDVPVYKFDKNTGAARQVGVLEARRNIATKDFVNSMAKVISAEVSIFTTDTIINSSYDSLIGTKVDSSYIKELKNNGGKVTYISDVLGKKYLTCTFAIPNVDGGKEAFISIHSSYEKTVNEAGLFQVEFSTMNFLCYFIISIALVILIRIGFMNPINRIRKATKQLSIGDMDLTYRIPIRRMNELGVTTNNINNFMERLHEIVLKIHKTTDETLNAVDNLTSSSQETSTATNEIIGNIQSVIQMTQKQSCAIENVDTIMNGASSAIDTLNIQVTKQNENVDESSSATEQMVGNTKSVGDNTKNMKIGFDGLNAAIQKGMEKSNDIIKAIQAIQEKSGSLGAANDTIQNIAGETNLLSMNASIESAHAGEAGKGFAVVAGEIRKLAEDSQKQSTVIGEHITEIADVIKVANEAGKEFDDAMKEIVINTERVAPLIDQIHFAMEEQNTTCNQVITSLSTIKDSSAQVTSSIKDVVGGMNNTKKEMNDVVQLTQSIVGSMDEMSSGSHQINQGSNLVAEEALKVKTMMTELNETLEQFKL